MRHLRYFLFFSGMLFLLTGCRPDYEQALDNMQATQRLVSAVVHPNYDAIQEAATEGANMNRIWVNGAFTSPILCVWQTTPRPLFLEQMLKNGSDVNYADRNGNTLLMYASGYEPQKYGFLPGKGNYSSADYAKLFLRYDADVSQQNKEGWTALDYAVQLDDDMAAMNLLLSYGAEVTPVVLSHALDFEGAYTHYQRLCWIRRRRAQFSRQSLMLRFAVTMRRCRNWRQKPIFLRQSDCKRFVTPLPSAMLILSDYCLRMVLEPFRPQMPLTTRCCKSQRCRTIPM